MEKESPMISVIMPAYNAEQYIREAINCILDQTYSDFELIIVDNASEDKTVEIIKSYSDSRIVLVANAKNMGMIFSVNNAFKTARGEYIALMHADDISPLDRFEKQIAYFEKNTDVDLLGGAFSFFGDKGNLPSEVYHPKSNDGIRLRLLTRTCFCNGAVMLKRASVEKHALLFENEYNLSEDYRFWTQAELLGLKLANLREIIYNYRIHGMQMSMVKAQEVNKMAERVKNEYIDTVYGKSTPYNIKLIRIVNDFKIFVQKEPESREEFREDYFSWFVLAIKNSLNRKELYSIVNVDTFQLFALSKKSISQFKYVGFFLPFKIQRSIVRRLVLKYNT